jgi:hypothetical protein
VRGRATLLGLRHRGRTRQRQRGCRLCGVGGRSWKPLRIQTFVELADERERACDRRRGRNVN